MNAQAPIGVFDSGVGGLSVLRALRAALPAEDFIYIADSAHAPYGERGDAYVAQRALHLTQQLVQTHGAKALVVACNTATAAAVHQLRTHWPALPIVGVEPALKPAASITRTGRVGVMATRGTLASAKFHALRDALTGPVQFVLQACDGLAEAIEQGDAQRIAVLCAQHTAAMGAFGTAPGQIDTLVLGCTHYPFAQDMLRPCIGEQVQMLETGEPVARQTLRLLQNATLLATRGNGTVTLLGTGAADGLHAAAARWLGPQACASADTAA